MNGLHDRDRVEPADRAHRQRAEAALHRRVRWFVAAHVAAVGLIYVIALSIGGGHAPPPFPPDLAVNHRHGMPTSTPGHGQATAAHRQAPAPLVDRSDLSGPARAMLAQREGAELSPPWLVDSSGVVRIRHD